MLTKNYHIIVSPSLLGGSVLDVQSGVVHYTGAFVPSAGKMLNNTNINLGTLMSTFPSAQNFSSGTSTKGTTSGVFFGDGTTPPAPSDYKLSGTWLKSLSANVSITREFDTNGYTLTALYTITNTSENEFTIREVGIVNDTTIQGPKYYSVLLERTLLETPVTIPAGGIGQVTYKIRYDYPT